MPDYTYMPIMGALPGKSFEEQTVAFFQALQRQLDTLSARVDALDLQTPNNLEAINERLNDLEGLISTAQVTADEAVAAASTAQATADQSVSDAAEAATAASNAQTTANTAIANAAAAQTTANQAKTDAATAQTTADKGVDDAAAAAIAAANAQKGADTAQATANGAVASSVPAGGIILFNKDALPTGWVAADGQNSTPNLQYYAAGNLKYAQKS